MLIVHHRRNSAALLAESPVQYGIEIDVRTIGSRLIVQHDPYVDGEDLERWLAGYRHQLLILNVKEEGLEEQLGQLMADNGIIDYFFLDQSFPFLVRTASNGERRCAVRVSEYESILTAMRLAPMIDWVWLDSFSGQLPDLSDLGTIAASHLRICLVSPELQGRTEDVGQEAIHMRSTFAKAGLTIDAVCTKLPHLWQ